MRVEDDNQIIIGCSVAEALKRPLFSFQQEKDILSTLTNKNQDVSFKKKTLNLFPPILENSYFCSNYFCKQKAIKAKSLINNNGVFS